MKRAAALGLLLPVAALAGIAASRIGYAPGAALPPNANPPPENQAPAITSPAAVSVAENSSGTVYTATGTDPEGAVVLFALAGGADRARFQITRSGALSFVTPPDFEAPADADGDNVYQVQIAADDGITSATLDLAVTVANQGPDGFRVRRVAAGLSQPLFVAPVPDGSGRVFVVERTGRIRILTPSTGAIAATPFLDLTGQVGLDGERGLLGFATAPDFAGSGVFYIFMSQPDGTNIVRRYTTAAGNRDVADPASASLVLAIPHPNFSNHNGGWIGFGPDSFLYVASGDGGSGGDPNRNGQNTGVLLGKMLRIDPSGDAFPNDPNRNYAIPAGNPFAAGGGAPEVWAYGLRNPFRNSFDPLTGNLFIADVGQDRVEEVDIARPGDGGVNFGWSQVEGTQPYNGTASPAFTLPVAEYLHGTGATQGNSITGGYVYRGPVEGLRGQYFFADYIRPNIWSVPVSRLVPGQTLPASQFILRSAAFAPNAGAFTNIASFGVDQAGNLYIVDIDGEIFVVEPTG